MRGAAYRHEGAVSFLQDDSWTILQAMGWAQLLLSHALVYGVWHPYKYVVTTFYKLLPPLFKLVEWVHTGFKVGDNVYMKYTFLHMAKSVLRLMAAEIDIRGRLSTRSPHVEGGGSETRARVLLQGFKTLIFWCAPVLLERHQAPGTV